jgi:hypothetical protein
MKSPPKIHGLGGPWCVWVTLAPGASGEKTRAGHGAGGTSCYYWARRSTAPGACSPGVLPLRDLNVAMIAREQGEQGPEAADLRPKDADAQACFIDGGPALAVVLHPGQRL